MKQTNFALPIFATKPPTGPARGHNRGRNKMAQPKIKIDFISSETKELANGATVKRGEIVEYTNGCPNSGAAVVMGWTKSGKTLYLQKASVRCSGGRVSRLKLYDGQHCTFVARHDPKTGKFKSSKFHGYTLLLPTPPRNAK